MLGRRVEGGGRGVIRQTRLRGLCEGAVHKLRCYWKRYRRLHGCYLHANDWQRAMFLPAAPQARSGPLPAAPRRGNTLLSSFAEKIRNKGSLMEDS